MPVLFDVGVSDILPITIVIVHVKCILPSEEGKEL
jgi:hypothetical protein